MKSLPDLKRYISRLLPYEDQSGEIEDIAQEVFIRTYVAKKENNLKNSKAFLFRVARNLSFNYYRSKKNSLVDTVEDFVLEGVVSSVPTGENQVFHKNRLKELTKGVSILPLKCREAFILRHLEGLSYKEIAKKMQISTSTVEKHLAKALLLITRHMREAGYSEDNNAPAKDVMEISHEID